MFNVIKNKDFFYAVAVRTQVNMPHGSILNRPLFKEKQTMPQPACAVVWLTSLYKMFVFRFYIYIYIYAYIFLIFLAASMLTECYALDVDLKHLNNVEHFRYHITINYDKSSSALIKRSKKKNNYNKLRPNYVLVRPTEKVSRKRATCGKNESRALWNSIPFHQYIFRQPQKCFTQRNK